MIYLTDVVVVIHFSSIILVLMAGEQLMILVEDYERGVRAISRNLITSSF